jgi:membrane protein implicated in regulation of membrane protease activity
MTWCLFWFIMCMAGIVGNVYYVLIGTGWPLRAAMFVLTVFSYAVMQCKWYRSKHPERKGL